jgi:hypothetical protein
LILANIIKREKQGRLSTCHKEVCQRRGLLAMNSYDLTNLI